MKRQGLEVGIHMVLEELLGGKNTGAKNPLSNEFKVATEIYACKENGELVWYTKLVQRLNGKMSKNTLAQAINTLFDWGIVKAEYGETETGRAGKLLMISNEAEPIVRDLYLKFWKDFR